MVQFEAGGGRAVLVVIAHADDLTLFIGGTVARWAEAGWRVLVVRVTDDRWDSVGLDEDATVLANRLEFETAAGILGVAGIVELGYPTDVLADQRETEMREHVIRLIRTYKPYALVTFDPHGGAPEDNQDHLKIAAAVDEAFWTAQFDKHHPEHLARGLQPHGAFERWYFAREAHAPSAVVDIAPVLDRKLRAANAHQTMIRNMVNQWRMQAATGGWTVPMLDAAQDGDLQEVVDLIVRTPARDAGHRHGLEYAEEWRVVRFGGMEALLTKYGVR